MNKVLEYIKQIQSIAETGLHYSQNPFELNRNREISELCLRILEEMTDADYKLIKLNIEENRGYKTPKVDVRAVIFNDLGEILMVKEKIDGKWALPGGWADIGYTPSEVAVKESLEEAGMIVEAKKLLAILDKRRHNHPSDLYYIYKVFIACDILEKAELDGIETSDSAFFSENNLPELSQQRNTAEQIKMLFDFRKGLKKSPVFD